MAEWRSPHALVFVLLASAPVVQGGGGPWGNENDTDSLYLWLLAAMMAVTIFYDYLLHTFTHWLQKAADEHHRHGANDEFAAFALNPWKLWKPWKQGG